MEGILAGYKANGQDFADLIENLKLMLSVTQPPKQAQNCTELLQQASLNENEEETVVALYKRGDPRILAIWECYKSINSLDDAVESLSLLPKLIDMPGNDEEFSYYENEESEESYEEDQDHSATTPVIPPKENEAKSQFLRS